MKSDITLDAGRCSVRDILAINPLPDKLDPFTAALVGGCDPVSAHQAVTLAFPILSFLGQHARVLYSDGTLRWISGQSWQMGGSGSGKSLVLQALEQLFLAREMREKTENARMAAAYTMLSAKERRELPVPQQKVRIFDGIPTALALLQLAINREVRSHRDLVRGNFKMQGIVRVQHEVDDARDEAFRAFEKQYEGTEKSLDEMHEIPIFQPLSLRTIRRLVQQRGYKSVKRGVYLVQSPATQHLEAA